MRAWEIVGAFGLENLALGARPEPEPGPRQLVVEVLATSLNYRDLLMVRGQYNPRQPLPLVPLSDAVGRVDAVGEGVERFKVGDRLATTFAPRWIAGTPSLAELRATRGGPLEGVLQDKLLVHEDECVAVPGYLSDAEAATLPCAALTAWSALVELDHVKAGDTVLVQGTGGVSVFALQIALALGARVIVTSSSDDKLARARELGATHTINYRTTPEWGKAARALTDAGVDHVIEVGGAGTLAESLRAVRPGGTISLIGVLSGGKTELVLANVFMSQVRVQGVLVGHRKGLEAMCRAFEATTLRPVIDRVFAFEEARGALEHLESGKHFGKVCVSVAG